MSPFEQLEDRNKGKKSLEKRKSIFRYRMALKQVGHKAKGICEYGKGIHRKRAI